MAKRIVKGNMNENDERNEIIKAAEQGDAEWAEKSYGMCVEWWDLGW